MRNILLATAVMFFAGISSARAATLFWEDFEGYTSFPDQNPSGDYINKGLALVSEGAKETWYGGRFQSGSSSSINSDLAIQKFGGGTNNTHTGRAGDDAGMLFKVNTVGMSSVTLDFDWRTFQTESGDYLRVGYYAGSVSFTGDEDSITDRFHDFQSGTPTWSNFTALGSMNSSTWAHKTYSLPVGQSSVWVAFWLDDGNSDFGKFDNILVTGTTPTGADVPSIPLPAAYAAGLAIMGLLVVRKALRARGA